MAKTKLEEEKEEKEKEKEEPNNKKALHYAYYYAILYQIYRMTKYSKIRHQDLHTQNIMIKSIDTISDIEGDTMADKIKSILNNSNFKINIKLIDYGKVRGLYEEEIEYCVKPIKMQKFLFEKYIVFEDYFIYSKFLHLTQVLEILTKKDILKTKIELGKLNYFDNYKGSIEQLIKEEDLRKYQLLLQRNKAKVREGVAPGAIPKGKNDLTSQYMFVLRDLEGEDTCQTGKFRKCPGENPIMILDKSSETIEVRSTYLGGGKKSKKNNKRKRKFRSKKNKK